MKKKIIISLIVLFVLTILLVGGYFLFSMFQAPAEIEDSDALYETTLKEAPSDGSIPSDYSVEDNIAFALYTLSNKKEFKSVTTGSAIAVGVNQSVSNVRVVKDGKAMVTMITSGFIENAKQRYFLEDKVLLRDAVKPLISETEANWATTEPECVTYNTIKKRYGWFPFEATGYIICNDTFLNKDKMQIRENNDKTYTLVFDLDPEATKAPFWYRREVLTNSNSTIIPEFFSIHIEMTIDANWNILQNEIKESYKVKSFGVEAVTDTSCLEEFFYDNVEFDQSSVDFFESYAYLSALDDASEEIEVKEDAMSIVVESLQNKDLSNKKLDIELDIDGAIVKGNAILNISDLNNVLVVAKIDDLYVAYDKNIYLKLGDLKLSCGLDDIEFLASKFKSENTNPISLDVNSILDELTKAKIEEKDSIIYINPVISINGIDINLHFEIKNDNGSYSLLNANVSTSIDGKNINLKIKESNKDIEILDTSDFTNVKSLEFVIDDVVSILNKKEFGTKINCNYKDIVVNGNLFVSFKDDIKVFSNISLKYKDKTINLDLSYINDTVYIDLLNQHLKIKKDDLLNIISKYSDISFDTNNLDLSNIIGTVLSIDFDKLLNEVRIEDNYIGLNLDISDFTDLIKEIKLELKKESNTKINVNTNDVNFDVEILDSFESKNINDLIYNNISYLDLLIDDVVLLYKSKELEINLEYINKDIKVKGLGYLDFKEDLKASFDLDFLYKDNSLSISLTYINDYIYIDYNDIHLSISKNRLVDFINDFVEIKEFSIDTILNIDFEKILKELTINENELEINLDLSDFLKELNDIKIALDLKNVINGTLELKDLGDISFNINSSNKDILLVNDYIDGNSIFDLVNKVLDIIKDKKVRLDLSLTKDDLSVNGNVLIDYNNDLKLNASLDINYKDINVLADVSYLKDYNGLNNVLLISLGNNDLLIELDKLNIPDINETNILDLLLSYDFNKLLVNLSINSSVIDLSLDLSMFNILDLSIIDLNIDYTNDLVISSNLYNLNIKVSNTLDDILLKNDYLNITDLINSILDIYNEIDNKSFRLNLVGNISLDSIDIDLDSKIDFIKENDSYTICGKLGIILLDNKFNIDLIYKNKVLYISYGNINFGIDLTNPKEFVNEAIKNLGLDDNNDLSIVNDLIESLIINEKGLSINNLLSFKNIEIILNNKKLNINSDKFMFNVSIDNIDSYNVVVPNEYLGNDKVLSILSTVGNILGLIENDSFSINLDMNTYRNLKHYLNINGQIDFSINKEENKKFSLDDLSLYIKLAITEYSDDKIKVVHRVELTLVNDYIYVTYGNNESNKNSKIKLYSKKDSIFRVISSLTDLVGLEIKLFDDYKTNKLDGIDIEQLKDLFKKDISIDFERLIDSIDVYNNEVLIKLNLNTFFDFVPDGILAGININSFDNSCELSLSNLLIDYVSDKENKRIDVNSLTIEKTDSVIKAPSSLSGYYNISNVDDLVFGLLHTASNKDYSMEATVNLNILSLININVPVDAKVRVLEDGSPLVYCHLEVPYVIFMLSKKDVYFYYYDGYVYIERVEGSTKYNLKVTYEEFFSDIVYYVLDFAMGMPDLVLNKIKDSQTDEDFVVDAGKVLTNYSYSNNKYTLGLDMGSLTGNSNLGEMSFKLNLEELGISYNEDNTVSHSVALTSISDFKMKLVSIISLNVSKLTLTNIESKDGYKWFTNINMDNVYKYTESYNYDVDKIYKNGRLDSKISHEIKFYDDNKTYQNTYYYNDLISFPNLSEKEVDGILYVFDGWYLDKHKTKRFDSLTMPAKDIELYAKWVLKD